MKRLIEELSPLIEEYTSRVCPGCGDVCCRQKRSLPEPADVVYLAALDEPLPGHDRSRDPEGPCQHLDSRGCTIPRPLRPWRCTWYFCTLLLAAVEDGPQKKARLLSSLIQEIVDIRSSWDKPSARS